MDSKELFDNREEMIKLIAEYYGQDSDMELLQNLPIIELQRKTKVILNNMAQKAENLANDSTGTQKINVDGSVLYVLSIADLHDEFEKLIKALNDIKKVPNAQIILLGDITSTAFKSTKAFEHENAKNSLEENLDNLVSAFKMTGTSNLISAIIDGNHEAWLKKDTGIRFNYLLASKLGIVDKYRETGWVMKINFANQSENIRPYVWQFSHGDELGGNSGKSAEVCLDKSKKYNADMITEGNNHKFGVSSVNYVVYNEKTKKLENRVASYFNLAQYQDLANYGLRAGYAPIPSNNGEIIRIISTNDAQRPYLTDYVFLSDLVGEKSAYGKAYEAVKSLEKQNYSSIEEIKQLYLESFVNFKSQQKSTKKTTKVPENIVVVPLGKAYLGNKNDAGVNELKKKVEEIKHIENAKIFLCGDMIFDDNNGRNKKDDISAKTISRVQMLAQILEPVKDKIVAYNSGVQEVGIMNYFAKELAKKSMKVLQLESKFAWMPMSATEKEEAKLEIQNQKVMEYNEALLTAEAQKFTCYSDSLKVLTKYAKTDKNYKENWISLKKYGGNPDYIKDCVAKMLNDPDIREKQGKYLLDSAVDKKEIEEKFIVSDDEVLKPNENLIQNMLFKALGLERNIPRNSLQGPQTIGFNTKINNPMYVKIPVTSKLGEKKDILVQSRYITTTAGRGAISNNMQGVNDGMKPDVCVCMASSSKEFMSKSKSSFIDPVTYETRTKIRYEISAGGLCEIKDRVKDETAPVCKVYECSIKPPYFKNTIPTNSVYADNETEIFHCSPKEYAFYSVDKKLYENENVQKMYQQSCELAINKFKQKQLENEAGKEKEEIKSFFADKKASNEHEAMGKTQKATSKSKKTTSNPEETATQGKGDN